MEDKIIMRLSAYELAGGNMELAREYMTFLEEAQDKKESDIRLVCLDKKAGCPISEVRELFAYLVD